MGHIAVLCEDNKNRAIAETDSRYQCGLWIFFFQSPGPQNKCSP